MTTSLTHRMTELLGTTPEPCKHCGWDVWACDEMETYVSIGYINMERFDGIDCSHNKGGHEVE